MIDCANKRRPNVTAPQHDGVEERGICSAAPKGRARHLKIRRKISKDAVFLLSLTIIMGGQPKVLGDSSKETQHPDLPDHPETGLCGNSGMLTLR